MRISLALFIVAVAGSRLAYAAEGDDDGAAVLGDADAEDGATLQYGAEAAAASRYAFRGFALSRSPVLTPSAWGSFADITLNSSLIVQTSPRDGDVMRELDVDLSYAKTFGPLTLEPDVAAYVTPTGGSTAEGIVTISLEGEVIGVHTSHAVDFVAAPGAYYAELGVTLGGEVLHDLTTSLSLDAGAGTARFHAYNAGVRVAGLTVVRVSSEVTLQVSEPIYVTARLELDALVAGPVRRAVEEPLFVHAGLAAGFAL